ncbi:response regulator [Deinococcus sonorensis]|uniref:response regulator n=1 Tax=Deinococcus sonorensis TaxID=309891 RepID=UPI003A94DDA5
MVSSGEAALARLDASTTARQCPHLILLDRKLPGRSGLTLLQQLTRHPQRCRIPVVILSVSHATCAVLASDQEDASSCLMKPERSKDRIRTLQALSAFWLRAATLVPSRLNGQNSV